MRKLLGILALSLFLGGCAGNVHTYQTKSSSFETVDGVALNNTIDNSKVELEINEKDNSLVFTYYGNEYKGNLVNCRDSETGYDFQVCSINFETKPKFSEEFALGGTGVSLDYDYSSVYIAFVLGGELMLGFDFEEVE